MADLKIPKFNMNSDKYIFKKKLSLKRKSKRRLFIESAFLFILSLLIVYINYLIPNKNLLLKNLPATFDKSLLLIVELIKNFYHLFLIIYIGVSSIIAFILLVGSLYRLFKIFKRRSKQITYK